MVGLLIFSECLGVINAEAHGTKKNIVKDAQDNNNNVRVCILRG